MTIEIFNWYTNEREVHHDVDAVENIPDGFIVRFKNNIAINFNNIYYWRVIKYIEGDIMRRRNKRRNRQYTYRLTTCGIDYVKNTCGTAPDNATYRDDWSIYRRHNSKHSPWNFELWINDTIFVDRWTAKAMKHWRQKDYIMPHADMWREHLRYTEKLLSKSILEEIK